MPYPTGISLSGKYTTSGKNNYIGGNIYFSPTKKNHKWIWDGKEYTDFSALAGCKW